jgi:PAS domain S-box-containing protein
MEHSEERPAASLAIDPALFQAMVEQAGDAMIFADLDGTVQVWNRGAERIFGYTAAETLAGNLDLIIPEPLRAAHWAGFRKAIQSGSTKHGDRVLTTRSMHKNGQKLYVDLHFCLITDASGAVAGALAIGRDCTARYLEEKARRP